MNYKMTIAYDGSRYNGWQRQGNTDNTIQGKLEQILEKRYGRTIEIHGSGRTDAGVHAEGQTANFHLEENEAPEDIRAYFNRYLPDDISVLNCEIVSERFHSRLSAVRKTYRYQIEMGEKKGVFVRHYYYGLGSSLDLSAMKRAGKILEGTHDFKSFCGNKRLKKSSVRTLESIRFQVLEGSRLHILYTGNGFLQQMVRILTGTLIGVGQGKRSPEEMRQILDACDRQAAGFTAPAQGLFLEKVMYEEAE